MKKILLLISLTVNVIFAVYLFVLKTPQSSDSEEQLTNVPQFDSSLIQNGEDVSVLYELQSKYMPKMTAPADHYWQRNADVMIKMADDKALVDESIRGELIKIYGDSAKTIAAFEQYFYPLGPGYDFLNSDLQLEVAGIRESHQRAMLALSSEGLNSLNRAQEQEANYWVRLENLLTVEQLFEYSLRESRLAQQMRAMQFDWSEAEFREVYRIRSEQSQSANLINPLSGKNVYNEDVKAYLGDYRYKDYISAADLSLARFKNQAEKTGLQGADLETAVDTYISYGEQISDAIQRNDRREVTRLNAERSREIGEITGLSLNNTSKMPLRLPRGSSAIKLQ